MRKDKCGWVYKSLMTILYIIAFSAIVMISLFIIIPLVNNFRLTNFGNQINSFTLPCNTFQVEKKSICGKLNGNGNGMDFLVCELVKSDLPLDTLKQYFSSITFKPVRDGENHKTEVEVLPARSSKVETKYLERDILLFDALNNINDYSNYYLVILYDGGYSADFDLRGH